MQKSIAVAGEPGVSVRLTSRCNVAVTLTLTPVAENGCTTTV
jgi:hypothetical protein